MRGQWIIKEVYFEDGFPKIIRDLKPETPDLPTWVGLTDEEIKSLPSWWPSYEDAPALIQLVKDVEAKLKEKNHE
jgi:hypothetical protein